jgi:hypothetical protein
LDRLAGCIGGFDMDLKPIYIVVCAEALLCEIESKVNEKLKEGYMPLGGVWHTRVDSHGLNTWHWYQAMILS